MTERLTTGGGKFDRTERAVYFLPTGPDHIGSIAADFTPHLLVALNAIRGPKDWDQFDRLLDRCSLFLDSGVFHLATTHAKAHDLTMDQALSLAPDDVDGWPELRDKWCATVEKYGHRLWGYTELDQGGRERKLETRAWLESLGHRPIPIYHPINDGWEYFDYLAQRYDRICVGNLVQAPGPVRKRLLATIGMRRRQYPGLWIHCLGVAPNPWLVAFPQSSCDASSWLHAVRFPEVKEKSALATVGTMPNEYAYQIGSARDGDRGVEKAWRLCAQRGALLGRTWEMMLNGYERMGVDLCL